MRSSTRHPEDSVLLRLLDGELVEAEARDHADVCRECRRRVDALARRSERLDDVLRSGDALIDEPAWDADFLSALAQASQAPPRRRRPLRAPAVRWAAAVVLLTALVSVSPLRAWVAQRAEAAWAWITTGAEQRGPSGLSDAGPGSTEVVASITGRVLTVRLSGPVTPDSLVVRATSEARARAIFGGRAEGRELLVRPDGFEVQASGGGGTLEVWVPPSVAEIRVTRDGDELTRPRGEDPGWSWRLALPEGVADPGAEPSPGADPGPVADPGSGA